FGCHVIEFELLRSSGERLICSPTQNFELFAATIGGLGLTGLITWAEIRLRRITTSLIDMESRKFADLDEFFAIAADSDGRFEYTVGWVDCLARGGSLGRGVFLRGNHAEVDEGDLTIHRPPHLNIPIELPAFLLNRISIQAFNTLYYARAG